MTSRHHPAKTAKAAPTACTTETVMLLSDAAARLKFVSCEDDEPSQGFESRCRAAVHARWRRRGVLLILNFVDSVNSVQNPISGVIFGA